MAKRPTPQYDDDFFADTRMTFGDHLEELRMRMWAAMKGLGLCLIIGFGLDAIGDATNQRWFGVGRPAMDFITKPIKAEVENFYARRYDDKNRQFTNENAVNNPTEVPWVTVPVQMPVAPLAEVFDDPKLKNPDQTEITLVLKFDSRRLDLGAKTGEIKNETKNYLAVMSVTEGFFVYFKISLLCGFIIACPWIFYQFWAFVGAGLYPHEKRHVHVYLPFSVVLFLIGVAVCQFLVIPGAIKALLGFNAWLNLDPDLRLSEWLGFAIIMPLVFGLSFQTPLVMMFLNRIGMFDWRDYWSKWRYAIMVMAVFSAIITPTPDAVTMLYLFVPMFGLYLFGVLICRMMPPPAFSEEDEYEEEVAV